MMKLFNILSSSCMLLRESAASGLIYGYRERYRLDAILT